MPTTQRIVTYAVRRGMSRAGVSQPGLYVDFDPPAPSTRVVRATLLRLLARVEELTPDGDRWIANEGRSTTRTGTLSLELADGNEHESERALELLRRIAEEAQP